MKLRISNNSIRFRLSQGEVNKLVEDGVVESRTEFPGGGELIYSISADRGFCASLEGTKVNIALPNQLVQEWAESEELSIENFIKLESGENLRLLVEKDLQCLTPRLHEDESDLFPNPNINC